MLQRSDSQQSGVWQEVYHPLPLEYDVSPSRLCFLPPFSSVYNEVVANCEIQDNEYQARRYYSLSGSHNIARSALILT